MKTYVTHYFNFEYIGIYLLVSLIGLAVVMKYCSWRSQIENTPATAR